MDIICYFHNSVKQLFSKLELIEVQTHRSIELSPFVATSSSRRNACLCNFMMWFIFSLQGKINNQKVRQQYRVYIYIYIYTKQFSNKKQCSNFLSLEHLLEPSRSKKVQTIISDFSCLMSVGHQHSLGHVLTSQFHWMFPAHPQCVGLTQFPVQAEFIYKFKLHMTVTYTYSIHMNTHMAGLSF